MNSNTTINTMSNTKSPLPHTTHRNILTLAGMLLLGIADGVFLAGCGPTFDPASLIETTRVLGARVEVDGDPARATPRPVETASVTWLITSPEAIPPLRWAFAVCAPGSVGGTTSLSCHSAPLAVFEGTNTTPRISISIPPLESLGGASSLLVYGEICSGGDSMPMFDPQSGIPGCTQGGGTTVSVSVPLQLGEDANHNPSADRALTFDGQVWPPSSSGDDPCLAGRRVSAGSKDHVIGHMTVASDRESYTSMAGDPPVATPKRESLQISQFTTAGKLKSQFSFVEATDENSETTVEVKWEAPKAEEVPAEGLPVTFTFVTRDNRGGTDWTTRSVCVSR